MENYVHVSINKFLPFDAPPVSCISNKNLHIDVVYYYCIKMCSNIMSTSMKRLIA